MAQFLATLTFWATVVFAGASMFSVGLQFSLRRILRPLKNIHGSVRALAANFVVVPLLAFGVGILLGLSLPDRIGLFLLGVGAGAPFLLKLGKLAQTDMAQTTSLLVLLLVASIFYMPLVLPFTFQNAQFSAVSIARPLVLNMLVPLAIGFAVRRVAPSFARRAAPSLSQIASVALAVLIAGTVLGNFPAVVGLIASRAFLGILLFVAAAFFFGWWMAPSERTEPVFGLGTGQRNVAAAAVVANESFTNPEIGVVVVIGAVLGFLFLFPAAFQLKKRAEIQKERAPLAPRMQPIEQKFIEHPFSRPLQESEPPRPSAGDRP